MPFAFTQAGYEIFVSGSAISADPDYSKNMQNRDKLEKLEKISKLIRYYSLAMSTEAGSGHPTSSLSATELMAGLLFGGSFRYDLDRPDHPNNDRLIFSKGHASPLFYSLWAAAGALAKKN